MPGRRKKRGNNFWDPNGPEAPVSVMNHRWELLTLLTLTPTHRVDKSCSTRSGSSWQKKMLRGVMLLKCSRGLASGFYRTSRKTTL